MQTACRPQAAWYDPSPTTDRPIENPQKAAERLRERSKILNHAERDVTAVYGRHSYDPEKQTALEACRLEEMPPMMAWLPKPCAAGAESRVPCAPLESHASQNGVLGGRMGDRVSTRKVAVVGAGMVGASYAFALLQRGIASELVLVDADRERAVGEAMDLSHGLPFVPATDVRAGGYKDLAGAALVVVTAGASQKPGQTRLDLLRANRVMCDDVIPRIVAAEPEAVILLASNPVDVLTFVAAEKAGLPWGRVIGSGTILDTARFRYLLGGHFAVDPHSVHAYVIAEHGDTAVPVWSSAAIGGVTLDRVRLPEGQRWDGSVRSDIFERTRTAAYEVIKRKRATYYAIGLGLLALTEAVLRDQRTVLTVSAPLRGEYGVRGMALSLPRIVGRSGALETLDLPLESAEQEAFARSADTLGTRLAEVS